MSDFESIFNDLTDLIESIPDKSVTERLDKARNFVLMASQQHMLGRSKGVDLMELGLCDERKHGRREGERRHNI